MWLQPREGTGSILCPASNLDLAELQSACERNRDFVFRAGHNHNNFSTFLKRKYAKVDMGDVRDCAELVARLDPEQCAWDATWLDDFRNDLAETGSWSMHFWAKPVQVRAATYATWAAALASPRRVRCVQDAAAPAIVTALSVTEQNSLGMPTNFFFAFTFFQQLSPPLVHSVFAEREPTLEPWYEPYSTKNMLRMFSFAFAGIADRLDAYVVTRDGNRARAAVWPTTSIPYTKRFQMICCFVDLN